MALQYIKDKGYEIIASTAPATSSFSNEGSNSTVTYLVANKDLPQFIEDVLGSAKVVFNSYITRSIPASHPQYPFQTAQQIESIQGYQPDGKIESPSAPTNTKYKDIQTNKPPFVGSYSYYKVTVQYTSKLYKIYTDEQLKTKWEDSVYFDVDPLKEKLTVIPNKFTDRKEYLRYTHIAKENDYEVLAWKNANYYAKYEVLNDKNELVPVSVPITADGGGKEKIIPKQKILFKWFQVPYSFVNRNGNIYNSFGKCNYFRFFEWEAGDLIFTDMQINRYDTGFLFNKFNIDPFSSVYDYYTQFFDSQYCDITFIYLHRDIDKGQEFASVPIGKEFGVVNVDGKVYSGSWNRVYYPNNQLWYYTESSARKEYGRPTYWSTDFAVKFTYREV